MEPLTFVLESGRLTAKLAQRSTFSCIDIGVHVGEVATHVVSTRANDRIDSSLHLSESKSQRRLINWGLPDVRSGLDILVLVVDARAIFVHLKFHKEGDVIHVQPEVEREVITRGGRK